MTAIRIAIVAIEFVFLTIINPYQLRAADYPLLATTAQSDKENASAVPSRIAPVDKALARQLLEFNTSFSDAEGRGDFDSAFRNLIAERSLAHQHFDDGHYIIHRINADVLWHNWNMTLTDQQRSDCCKASEYLITAVQLEESHDYSKAAENFQKGIQVYSDLNSPPTASFAGIYNHFSNVLCSSGKPQEAIKQADRAFNTIVSSDGQFSPFVASALRAQATAYAYSGEYSMSLRKASRACQIWAACDPDFAINESTSNSYDSLLSWCFNDFLAIKNYDRASQCLNELTKLRSQCKPVDNLKLLEIKKLEYCLLEATDHDKEALAKAEEWLDFAQQLFTSDSEEVQEAKTASAEILLTSNETARAGKIVRELVAVKLKNNPSRAVEASWLTDVYSQLLVAENRYQDAVSMLEQRVQAVDQEFEVCDRNLPALLGAYAIALRKIGRVDDAKAVEDRIASINEKLTKMRREIEADPQCRFRWENQ